MLTPLTEAEATHVATVFETHSGFIETIARRHSVFPSAVPDIVQTVGMQVCRGLRGFRGSAGITTWLYRVTVNTARDHFRAEQKQVRATERLTSQQRSAVRWSGLPMAIGTPEADTAHVAIEQVAQRERAAALRASITRLRPALAAPLRDDLNDSPVIHSRQARHRAIKGARELLKTDRTFAD